MATLDLTLDKMRFPGIENFNPEFGTKETMGRGVHSVNLSENDMMPFLLQRPVSVVENSSTGDIEADRKLAIETSGVTLTLGRPSYPGCKVTVYGSFSSGTATVAYDKDANDVSSVVVGAGERVELEANALRFFEVKAPAMSELVVASGTLSQAKTIPLGYASDAKLAFKVVFPQGHNDATSADSLTLNGIAVVSNQNGTLAPIPHHAMTEGGSTVYKVLDPNTTLEMYYTADYDGNGTPAFVIVGNPLVLSSSSYSIYANGYNDNYNKPDWNNKQSIPLTNSSPSYTVPSDGWVAGRFYSNNNTTTSLYISSVLVAIATNAVSYGFYGMVQMKVNKGDIVLFDGSIYDVALYFIPHK